MEKEEKAKWLAKTLRGMEGRVLVVEGKRDLWALREIGVSTEVVLANGKTDAIVEEAIRISHEAKKPVALLFDFDAEGKRKTAFFKEAFYAHDANADIGLGMEVGRLFRVRTIEELPVSLAGILEETA